MIVLNSNYKIEGSNTCITFSQENENHITGIYDNGTVTGILEGNLLTATFHNNVENVNGLMEIVFYQNGFDAKWKSGLEPGPMRGKWKGLIGLDEKLENIEAGSINKVGIYVTQSEEDPKKISPLSDAEEKSSMLNIKFEHKSTLVISLKLDDTNYDPEADSDLVRKQKLSGYLKAIIYLLNELTGEIYGKDQLGTVEFLLKNKSQSYAGKLGIDLLNKIYQTIDDEKTINDDLHKKYFFENTIWPDVEMKKIDFDESFVYSTWDTSYILIGFNRFAHEIKENINLLLSEWGDENLNWNMEIGDNESNSKYGNYFTITASEEEIDGLDDEDE